MAAKQNDAWHQVGVHMHDAWEEAWEPLRKHSWILMPLLALHIVAFGIYIVLVAWEDIKFKREHADELSNTKPERKRD